MNAFTDDDLKRLKEQANKDLSGHAAENGWVNIRGDRLIALLARLEAAEDFIKHVRMCDEGWMGIDSYKSWRKSKGE